MKNTEIGEKMKEEIMQRISAVINALNTVSVSGKHNYNTMAGCISILEGMVEQLAEVEIQKQTDKK